MSFPKTIKQIKVVKNDKKRNNKTKPLQQKKDKNKHL